MTFKEFPRLLYSLFDLRSGIRIVDAQSSRHALSVYSIIKKSKVKMRPPKKRFAAMEENDRAVFLLALRNVTEAHGGMASVAEKARLNRENLYRMLSEKGNPGIKSVFSLLRSMGLKLTVAPKGKAAKSSKNKSAA